MDKSSWHIGIALGVGVKTNPLMDGKNIPLIILPDIAWYAEQIYFDNGELGYQWINQPKYAFETFIELERERAFFSFLHPANILLSTQGISSNSPAEEIKVSQQNLSIDEIGSRKWAINGGIRGHYFLSSGEWQLTFQQDISNVHKGQKVGIEYSHRWLWNKFKLGLRIGTDWKSDNLIDYYYGVSQRDTDISAFYFKGQSGLQPYVSLMAHKPINENWSWLGNLGYRWLPDSLIASPLVQQDNIRNIFLGVAYRF